MRQLIKSAGAIAALCVLAAGITTVAAHHSTTMFDHSKTVVIKGTVVEVKKDATTSHVRVDIGGGQILTSSITNEAVDELGIKADSAVTVVVKASDMMIGVD